MLSVEDVDAMIAPGGAYAPRWGWHDDHRHLDKTESYLPALMQVRAEFAAFLAVIAELPERRAVLQLGMGNCKASHDVWYAMFERAVTIDFGGLWMNGEAPLPGRSTHDLAALQFARQMRYDLLFIDAGHLEADVAQDHYDYRQFVKPGGIIAFHDAMPRAEFPEIGVADYLRKMIDSDRVAMIGTEVGIAWMRREA